MSRKTRSLHTIPIVLLILQHRTQVTGTNAFLSVLSHTHKSIFNGTVGGAAKIWGSVLRAPVALLARIQDAVAALRESTFGGNNLAMTTARLPVLSYACPTLLNDANAVAAITIHYVLIVTLFTE